jgi:hypothetical protein
VFASNCKRCAAERVLKAFFQMNLRRGFHRVFVIVWALYAAVILLWPFYAAEKATGEAISIAAVEYQLCLDARARANGGLYRDADDFKVCEAERQKSLANLHMGPWMIWKYDLGSQLGWNLLWIVPAVILIPPLIVYGIIRLLVKTSQWVAGGFRESRA